MPLVYTVYAFVFPLSVSWWRMRNAQFGPAYRQYFGLFCRAVARRRLLTQESHFQGRAIFKSHLWQGKCYCSSFSPSFPVFPCCPPFHRHTIPVYRRCRCAVALTKQNFIITPVTSYRLRSWTSAWPVWKTKEQRFSSPTPFLYGVQLDPVWRHVWQTVLPSGICMGVSEETIQNLSQNSRSWCQDLNLGRPGYEAGVPATHRRVGVTWQYCSRCCGRQRVQQCVRAIS
jgi:hypothetical protein